MTCHPLGLTLTRLSLQYRPNEDVAKISYQPALGSKTTRQVTPPLGGFDKFNCRKGKKNDIK